MADLDIRAVIAVFKQVLIAYLVLGETGSMLAVVPGQSGGSWRSLMFSSAWDS